MKIIITNSTMIGGVWYDPGHLPQEVPDAVGEHMIQMGAAQPFETKVVEVTEKKSSGASQAAPVSQKKTVRKRKPRVKKSSPSTTTID